MQGRGGPMSYVMHQIHVLGPALQTLMHWHGSSISFASLVKSMQVFNVPWNGRAQVEVQTIQSWMPEYLKKKPAEQNLLEELNKMLTKFQLRPEQCLRPMSEMMPAFFRSWARNLCNGKKSFAKSIFLINRFLCDVANPCSWACSIDTYALAWLIQLFCMTCEEYASFFNIKWNGRTQVEV